MSGISLFNISAPFWALVFGVVVSAVTETSFGRGAARDRAETT